MKFTAANQEHQRPVAEAETHIHKHTCTCTHTEYISKNEISLTN